VIGEVVKCAQAESGIAWKAAVCVEDTAKDKFLSQRVTARTRADNALSPAATVQALEATTIANATYPRENAVPTI
jgi:hypothetical protein